MNEIIDVPSVEMESAPLTIEQHLDRIHDVLVIVVTQLEELCKWKRDVEQAMSEVQGSGMLGMIAKLIR